ncbi:MAG: serine hydrolase domain-containing protein [bacterium]
MKRLILILILPIVALLFDPAVLLAEEGFPDSPAGNRAEEVFELLNGTSSTTVEDYVQNSFTPTFRDAFPMDMHLGLFAMVQESFGKLRLVSTEEFVANQVVVAVCNLNGDKYLQYTIDVEADEPHRIARMGVTPIPSPEGAPPPKESEVKSEKQPPEEQEIKDLDIDELREWLDTKVVNDEFSGVVLVARNGEKLFHEAYGLASKRFNVENTLDTRFNLGSINKVFTSVAISKLMDGSKVSIDDPIGRYLDIFPDDISEKVTVRHLLNMEAGWGDYWGNESYLAKQNDIRAISDYMEFLKDVPLDFEPGATNQHCNTCFMVLGAIIEAVTGRNYFDYIRETVYRPAGMINSDSYDRDSPVQNIAVGYTRQNPYIPESSEERWANTYLLSPKGAADGGGYSTTEDMLKFGAALRQYKLLSPQYTHFLLKHFRGSPEDADEFPNGPLRVAGGAPGVSTSVNLFLAGGYDVVVLSNYDFPAAMTIANEIIAKTRPH